MTADRCASNSLAFAPGQRLAFDYVNWRGERAVRVAFPVSMRHGATEWHPEPQWLVLARDAERLADREFALADMAPAEGARLPFLENQRTALRLASGGEQPEAPLRPVALRFESVPGANGIQWILESASESAGMPTGDIPIHRLAPFRVREHLR